MISYFVRATKHDSLEQVNALPKLGGSWVYGTVVTPSELHDVATAHLLDADVLRNMFDQHELPRTEYSNGVVYVFLRTPRKAQGKNNGNPFVAALARHSLVTLSSTSSPSPVDVMATNPYTTHRSRHALVQLISYVISLYETEIRHIEKYISETGERLESHEVTNKDFVRFVTAEQNLNEYRTHLTGLHNLTQRLHDNKHNVFGDSEVDLLEDALLHVGQLSVTIETQLALIDSIRNAYTTISNNMLNLRIKALTMLTLLLTLPNVFFGMYGMNIALPFQDEPWAYWAVLGGTLLVIIAVAIGVRRRRL